MGLWTYVGIFVEKEGSNEGDASAEIASGTPEDEADLLILTECACFLEEFKDVILPFLKS